MRAFRDIGLAVEDIDGLVVGQSLLAGQFADDRGGRAVVDQRKYDGAGTHGY